MASRLAEQAKSTTKVTTSHAPRLEKKKRKLKIYIYRERERDCSPEWRRGSPRRRRRRRPWRARATRQAGGGWATRRGCGCTRSRHWPPRRPGPGGARRGARAARWPWRWPPGFRAAWRGPGPPRWRGAGGGWTRTTRWSPRPPWTPARAAAATAARGAGSSGGVGWSATGHSRAEEEGGRGEEGGSLQFVACRSRGMSGNEAREERNKATLFLVGLQPYFLAPKI